MSIPIPTDETLDALRYTLRHLTTPGKLENSPWAASPLVTKHMRKHPGLLQANALHAVLTEVLTLLEQVNKDHATLLRGRFWEGLRVAEMLHTSRPYPMEERTFYLQQQEAIRHFGTLLLAQEQAQQQARANHRLLARLPVPTYERLFGVEAAVECLLPYLRDPERYFILSIKGMGGIGKTALADHVVRSFLAEDDSLHDLVWISAKQEHLTTSGINGIGNSAATQIRLEHIFDELGHKLNLPEVLRLPLEQKVEKLAGLLRKAPHLIVIDNLETVTDFQRLVPWLTALADPTKFLLTSRMTVPSLMRVTSVPLHGLDRTAGLALIDYVADVKQVDDCDAQRVYDLVGGNPLAIILLVSQMQTLPPTAVLNSVKTGSAEEMYRYIYWNAWRALRLSAQELLFAIQRAGDVAEWEWLMLVSEAPAPAVQESLGQLIDFSLVQPQRSNEGQRAFAIHRLTSTFLRTEVLGWK